MENTEDSEEAGVVAASRFVLERWRDDISVQLSDILTEACHTFPQSHHAN